jgi:hypothetical protein
MFNALRFANCPLTQHTPAQHTPAQHALTRRSLARGCLAAAALLATSLLGTAASAQQWAEKMFETKKHDFGAVAAAAETVYKFPVKNLYKEDIHIASVRASCGCTTPSIENQVLKTGQVGYVVARFNTGTFRGQRGANLTVVIDQPYYAEVQLRVDGYIRKDLVFNPGKIDFGQLIQGDAASRTVDVAYAGRSDWQVTGVSSSNENVKAELVETQRANGRVAYQIKVDLSEEAQIGFIRDAIVLTTNDRKLDRIPLALTAEVKPAVSVSPQDMLLGDLKPGEVKEQRLVIKSAKQAFIPQAIEVDGFEIEFTLPTEAKQTHLINVKITASESQAGQKQGQLKVITDLPGQPTATANVMANVVTQ